MVVTGLSGAGKTTAMQAFEDAGFYAADNVPPSLWTQLVAEAQRAGVSRLVLGIDIRAGTTFLDETPAALAALAEGGNAATVLFLDATEAALIRRFNFTRRTHPVRRGGVVEGVAAEREALEPLRLHADRIVDTTGLSAKELTRLVWGMVTAEPTFTVRLVSFGFKRGAPSDVDLMLDVRGMPNPYYDPGLRALPGTEAAVQAYVFSDDGLALYDDLQRLAASSAEAARDGDRASYSIGIGCTGGQHRSVAVAERLSHDLADRFHLDVRHRDIEDALKEHRDV